MPAKKAKTKKQPRDVNELAFDIVSSFVSETPPTASLEEEFEERDAVTMGRLGGLKGGRARAQKLTAEERKTIAQKAGQARWAKSKK